MDMRAYVESHAREFIDDLKQWLAIPSISADPAHHGDVRRSAEWLAARLRTIGSAFAEIWETAPDGLPAVFAEWPANNSNAPRVLIYGHHDVQPVEPLQEWDAPPFEPAERDGLLLARGASDDKGQVLFHSLGLRACLAASRMAAPPVTVKLLIEGEEESGSEHFAELLRRERAQRHQHVGRRRAVHVHRHARAGLGRGHPDRPGPGPALRVVRRRGAEPGARPGRPAGRPARRGGPGHPAPLLRPGAGAVRRGTGTVRPAAVRREGVAGRGPGKV